jgi:hypothetical protein
MLAKNLACVFALSMGVGVSTAHAVTVTIPVVKDNTLFEDPVGWTGGGASDGVYDGHTGTSGTGIRRALVQFDLSSIPHGSTITSVQLNIILVKVNNGTNTHTVHRMLNSWGEGASVSFGGSGVNAEVGDATWLFRFYPTQPWNSQGGDYLTVASATRSIGTTLGTYSFSSTGSLVADVQGWINNPATNFGWMIRGNETGNKTAKKFASREYFATGVPIGSYAPTVTIAYTPPPPCTADKYPVPNGDGQVNIDDLVLVITEWGNCG